MNSSQRVFVNTVAQYIRTIINMLLSLYTVRLVLASLGQSDYGLYSLVAGVVAMLSFITNSLVSTTQRFVSYYQGKSDRSYVKKIFDNCLLVHIILGIIVTIILESITPLLFEGFLVIPEGRLDAAVIVYHIVVIMVFISFIQSPYRAMLTSHENIVYISIVDILDAIIKVVLVALMIVLDVDKLIFYALIMLFLQILNLLAFLIYCYSKYEECSILKMSDLKLSFVKELMSFAGWRMYGTLCITARDQGISILLNRTFGTVMNAAWGIGSQLSSYTQFLSSSIVNAMTPQIVKSEGGNNRERSIFLSNVLSKITFFLMSIIGIPFIFEIETILELWLGTPPENASFFAIMFIIALLVDTLTIGLTHLNNAIGKIALYTIVMTTPKALTFLFALAFIKLGMSLYSIAIAYILIELLCSIIRIPMIGRQAGFKTSDFITKVIKPLLLPIGGNVLVCLLCINLFNTEWRFILTFILSVSIYSICFYYFSFSNSERKLFNSVLNSIKIKLKINNNSL